MVAFGHTTPYQRIGATLTATPIPMITPASMVLDRIVAVSYRTIAIYSKDAMKVTRSAERSANLDSMAIQELVDEVERSYGETQERMSDPAVYNDHREAAEVGRRLKELEAAHKLAQEWREVATTSTRRAATATCASSFPSSRSGWPRSRRS